MSNLNPLPKNLTRLKEVHLDMDGLFADFVQGVKTLTGKHPDQLEEDEMWKAIDGCPYFFEDLPLMKGSDRLWDVVKHSPVVKFLTGAPSTKRFHAQKRICIARHFGTAYEVNVVPSEDKPKFSGKGKLLIDDSKDNITAWVAAGGIGIHHDGDYQKTIMKFLTAVQELTEPDN